ncbi:MAG: hypothetical protein DRH12_18055 [Deltaproteobacteria bacterium]|nr:MAG: hypothetical protein DRH12_18055 [Deltaproteobacteria bacterium]
MKKIVTLKEWEEYVGTLRDLKEHEGMTFLGFDDCYINVCRELNVEKYIGKKIDVLRTDIEGRDWWYNKTLPIASPIIYFACRIRESIEAAVEIFKTLKELPDEPIIVDLNNGDPVI